ncbi:MAG: endopeptidase La [Gammaproteobacteria bacterium]|nr:endopeptidase La [Gammaproteobacteria bacterium]NNF61356.1 endopeptidase La [Gammaproteobacteria bacterium]
MDIEQDSDTETTEQPGPGSGIILASETLPPSISLLPVEARPFFPGQAIPLVINEQWEATIRAVLETEQKIVGIVLLRDGAAQPPVPTDFHRMGTACRLHRVQRADGQLQVLLEGLQRFRIGDWISRKQPYTASVTYFPETRYARAEEIKGYAVAIINTIKELLPLNPLYGEELQVFLQHFNPNEPSQLADFAAAMTTASRKELQEVLETVRILPRLERVLSLMNKELEVARSQMAIRKQVEEELQGRQREMFLREQLKAIQKELGISKDDRTAELDEFRERIAAREFPEHAKTRLDEEMKKLGMLETGSPEYAVTRNYLDWLTSLPWGVYTDDQFDLARARKVLDRDHEALDDVKQRIIEFLGVGIMRGEIAGSILLLVGPPGVGKTSLGRSIAEALGRDFYRFSVGGMRDEAEIKGHRRTYIGAMPGKFIQGIKETGSANPVIMLDEIDKIGASYRGDPASALLEVLDPEQNDSFLDHYLDVRFDLSKVLFICTANQLDTIPGPLLDRMETIRLSGYLTTEKLAIASRHLLPRQLQRAGIDKSKLRIDRAAVRLLIEGYAREAGVRKLEKQLGTIVRKAVIKLLEKTKPPIRVRKADVLEYLGRPVFRESKRMSGVGVVTGLAWTPLGGDTLAIEATRIHEFSRGFKLTGQLGDVMRESAEIAYSYSISHAERFDIDHDFFEKAYIHLHVPAGATPKDGPSAGITMTTALLSLASRRRIPAALAMTGEMTLTGKVLAVGGIREKVVAARRAKIKRIIMPEANEGDFEELPDYVRRGITAHFVADFTQVGEIIFPG